MTDLITTAHRDTFIDQGYLRIDNVVPGALCDRVIDAMCAFIGVDLTDQLSWRNYQKQGHGIVPLHHHQALWDVRQLPALHQVFTALYGTDQLWVTHDRVSFKLPNTARDDAFRMDPVHWDGDPRQTSLAMQGLIYLSDTPAEQGAFGMVPDLYRHLDQWLQSHGGDTELRRPNVDDYPLVPVPGNKGTLVLWHRRMPHTSLPNNGVAPRLVQYVTMQPPSSDTAARDVIARDCLEKRPPAWAIRQHVEGQLDPEPGPAVQLTPLGRKLTGIDPW